MSNGLIFSQIKRASKNLLILWAIILAVSTVVLLVESGEFINYVKGANQVDISKISSLKIGGFNSTSYVQVNPEEVIDIDLQYVEYSNSDKSNKTVKTKYMALRSGRNIVFAAIPPSEVDEKLFTGWVREMSDEEKAHLGTDIHDASAAGYIVSPYIFDVAGQPTAAGLFVIFGGLSLAALFFIVHSIMHISNPRSHKAYKNLSRFGDPEFLCSNLENIMLTRQAERMGKVIYLNPYVILETTFGFKLAKLDNVLWAYKKVTKHSTNFIPTGKTYELVFGLSNGTMLSMPMKELYVNTLLEKAKRDYPWIVVGYSEEIKRLWNSRFNEFVTYVEAQKQETINS